MRKVEPLYGNKGSFLAFKRPTKLVKKGEKHHEIGVLCNNLLTVAYIGTCLMEDNRLQTYKYTDLKIAHKRYTQLDPKDAQAVPKQQLLSRLQELETQVDYKLLIASSEAAFHAISTVERRPSNHATMAAGKRTVQRKASHNIPVAKSRKEKSIPQIFELGTLLAMWFKPQEGDRTRQDDNSPGE